jgi:hypothetical protein
LVPSGGTAVLPAVADGSVSAVPPKDGNDTASRRNTAARAFFTIYPSKKPP